MIRQLLWKEWREHGWKMWFASAMIGVLMGVGIFGRIISVEEIYWETYVLLMFPIPLFISVGLISSERADGAHRFLFSLPVSPSLAWSVKTLIGILLITIPLIILHVLLFFTDFIENYEYSTFFYRFMLFITPLWVAVQFLVWTMTFSAKSDSEAKAGFIGTVIILLWGLLWTTAFFGLGFNRQASEPLPLWFALIPTSLFVWEQKPVQNILLLFLIQFSITISIWWWGKARFSVVRRES